MRIIVLELDFDAWDRILACVLLFDSSVVALSFFPSIHTCVWLIQICDSVSNKRSLNCLHFSWFLCVHEILRSRKMMFSRKRTQRETPIGMGNFASKYAMLLSPFFFVFRHFHFHAFNPQLSVCVCTRGFFFYLSSTTHSNSVFFFSGCFWHWKMLLLFIPAGNSVAQAKMYAKCINVKMLTFILSTRSCAYAVCFPNGTQHTVFDVDSEY